MPSHWYAKPQFPFWETKQFKVIPRKKGKHACMSDLFAQEDVFKENDEIRQMLVLYERV